MSLRERLPFRAAVAVILFGVVSLILVTMSGNGEPIGPTASGQTTSVAPNPPPTPSPRKVDPETAGATESLIGIWEFVAVENSTNAETTSNLENGFVRFDAPGDLGPSAGVYRTGGCSEGGGAIEISDNVMSVVEEYGIASLDCPGIDPVPILEVVYLSMREGLPYEVTAERLRLLLSDGSTAVLRPKG